MNVALAALAGRLTAWETKRSGLLAPGSPLLERPFLSWGLVTPVVFALSVPLALVSVEAAQFSWLLCLLGFLEHSD